VHETAGVNVIERAVETLHGYLELGNDVVDGPHARYVRCPPCPTVYDANCVTRIRARTDDDIAALAAETDGHFGALPFRSFRLDPFTPPGVEARLALDGTEGDDVIELLLEGPLRAEPRRHDIRPVADEDDWRSLGQLMRMDHEETNARHGRDCWPPDVTDQMVIQKRRKAPHVQFFLARLDGDDVGFFSAWPGAEGTGVGKVEDLFTAPTARHRGVATALIAHAVADARHRGARDVLIGADPADTPKRMYADLGFRPLLLGRSLLVRVAPAGH
jgi:GNAT superfamily N-acetyltransferase